MAVLAEQYIEFIAKGLDKVEQDMDEVKEGLAKVTELTKGMHEQGEKSSALFSLAIRAIGLESVSLSDGMTKATNAIVSGFKSASSAAALLTVGLQKVSSTLEGFARSGLGGTSTGNLLSLQFQILSREITSVFLPTILKVSDALQSLIYWFRRLNGSQQDTFQRIGEGIAVFVAATAAMRTATYTLAGFSTTLGAVAGFVSPVVVALAALTVGTESGRQGFSRMVEAMQPIFQRLAAFGARIYEIFLPAIVAVNDAIGGVFSSLAQPNGANSVFGAIGQAAESVARMLSDLIQTAVPLLKGAFEAVAPVVTVIANAVKSVADAVVPIVQNVIGTLQPAFEAVSASVGRMLERFRESGAAARFTELFERIGEAIPRIFEVLGALVEQSLPAIEAGFQAILPAVELTIRGLTVAVQILSAWLGKMAEDIGMIGSMLRPVWQGVTSLSSAIQDANNGWRDMAAIVSDLAENGMARLTARFGVLGTLIEGMTPGLQALAALVGGIDALTSVARQDGQQQPAEMANNSNEQQQQIDEMFRKPAPRQQADQPANGRRDVNASGGQFEQASSLFRRLQEAALRGAREQRQEARDERNANNLQIIANAAQARTGPMISADPTSLLLEKKKVFLMNGGV